jgi:hypothetical protein
MVDETAMDGQVKVWPVKTETRYVYAIGRIAPRFDRLDVEKEFLQIAGRDKPVDPTDPQILGPLLAEPRFRYLVREISWVLTVAGVKTYLLRPHALTDLDLLAGAFPASSEGVDTDLVIGTHPHPMATPLPIIEFHHIYSFGLEPFIRSIPGVSDSPNVRRTAQELFLALSQLHRGTTDEGRALNYLAVRYPVIYTKTIELQARNLTILSLQVAPVATPGGRRIMSVVIGFGNGASNMVERWAAKVDVTGEFPFLVSEMSPYISTS